MVALHFTCAVNGLEFHEVASILPLERHLGRLCFSHKVKEADMRKFLAVATLSALVAGCAGSADYAAPIGPQASIPFADHGNIRDFHAVSDDTVYLQARNRQWYRADLIGPCFGLPYANGIGIDARPMGTLDRFGTIIVEGERCKIGSLTPSPSPRQQS
jgi:hypothetical protein